MLGCTVRNSQQNSYDLTKFFLCHLYQKYYKYVSKKDLAPLYWPREKSFDQSVVLQLNPLKQTAQNLLLLNPDLTQLFWMQRGEKYFLTVETRIAKEFCTTYILGLLALSL